MEMDRLLVASALDGELLRRLMESPDEVFQEFDLAEEEKDLLRHPDHRLLPLFGEALARQRASTVEPPAELSPPVYVAVDKVAGALPVVSLVLTIVPCVHQAGLSYALWVNPLAPGADPAASAAPPGSTFPGQPLAPLHAVIQVHPTQMLDAAGNLQIGLSAVFQQSSNRIAPALPESAGRATGSPFGGDLQSPGVRHAIDGVKNAPTGERYDRLIELLHVLRRPTATGVVP